MVQIEDNSQKSCTSNLIIEYSKIFHFWLSWPCLNSSVGTALIETFGLIPGWDSQMTFRNRQWFDLIRTSSIQ